MPTKTYTEKTQIMAVRDNLSKLLVCFIVVGRNCLGQICYEEILKCYYCRLSEYRILKSEDVGSCLLESFVVDISPDDSCKGYL